ncbi:phage integrase [Arhodomonas sp. AD133]|uniref:phage integrase n=1 Tax=Arhodomonas sp. AD133 TaxID=3415009 RepID=UPI003EB73F80
MAIRKINTGWQVDIWTDGRGSRRIRKTFKTKAEAARYERWVRAKVQSEPEWRPPKKDRRRLTDLVDRWLEVHGLQLKDGTRRAADMRTAAHAMGNPQAAGFTARQFTEYRARCLEDGLTPATLNRKLAYFRAMFRELERVGEWNRGNPLAQVRQFRVDETELAWLTRDEIAALWWALRQSSNPDALRVARLCLATGARWSEAEQLRGEQLFSDRVRYGRTKGARVRVVPISERLSRSLALHQRGRLFTSCYAAFRKAVDRAGLELPRGQCSHVLRHTFATHFMARGGSILVLQRILGHTDIRMTMRYAHFAPDHLREALHLNPLAPRRQFVDTRPQTRLSAKGNV